MPVAIKTDSDALYAYSKPQLEQANRELEVMKKEESVGRRVNKAAGDLRVKRVMHKTHLFNALAAGEDPRHDETYVKDHVKKGLIYEPPVVLEGIRARPLSRQGRENFDTIDWSRGRCRL